MTRVSRDDGEWPMFAPNDITITPGNDMMTTSIHQDFLMAVFGQCTRKGKRWHVKIPLLMVKETEVIKKCIHLCSLP